jgi:hypothetical protein
LKKINPKNSPPLGGISANLTPLRKRGARGDLEERVIEAINYN